MRFLALVCRMALLVAIALGLLVLWIYGSTFLSVELHGLGIPSGVATALAILCTILLAAFVPALPIHTLFPSRAPLAAAAIGWLPLAASMLLVSQLDGNTTVLWAAKSVLEAAACWVAVVAGAGLAGRIKRAP